VAWGIACVTLTRLIATTSFRLAATYLVISCSSVLVLGGVVYFAVREEIVSEIDRRVKLESADFSAQFRRDGLTRLAERLRARKAAGAVLDYWLEDGAGRPLAGGPPFMKAEDGAYHEGWTTKLVKTEYQGDEPDFHLERALVTRLGDGSFLVVGDELDGVEEVRSAVLMTFFWALAAMIGIGTVGGLFFSAIFLHQIDSITATAHEIVGGDLSRRISSTRGDADLKRLAEAFNRMLDRIVALLDANRQASSAIAHDLRRPLARVLRALEKVRAGPADLIEYEKAVEAASTDILGVLETFGAILRIGEVESGARRAKFRMVDLAAIALEVAETFRPAASDDGRTLTFDLDATLPMVGDSELLMQMTANLIENAIRHTPRGSHIEVRSVSDETGARLIVADNGVGVPASERERIFERFYRVGVARGTSGDGLGLSLVAAIVGLHDAKVFACDNEPGLRIVFELPRRRGTEEPDVWRRRASPPAQ
jgi:signal transduction histidine kinase